MEDASTTADGSLEAEMIVGFTGTQQGMTEQQARVLVLIVSAFRMTEFHHGDCIGADAQAHDIVRKNSSCKIHIHPPIIRSKRAFKIADVVYQEKEYLARNRDIVAACDLLIATPKLPVEELRSGTWATIRDARRNGKSLYIITPNGYVQQT